MRTRATKYLNRHTLKPEYGFQVFHDNKWKSVAENGEPCIYKTEKERDEKRAQYRKLKSSNASNEPTPLAAVGSNDGLAVRPMKARRLMEI